MMPANVDIQLGADSKGKQYLVDGDKRLLYTFYPALTTYEYDLVEKLPEPTRAWAGLWQPLDLGTDRAPKVSGVNSNLFQKQSVVRAGRQVYEVLMTVDLEWQPNTSGSKSEPYQLKLYTYKFDLPLANYEVPVPRGYNPNPPPGYVRGLWHPAEIGAQSIPTAAEIAELGGGTGGTYGGGP